MDQPPSARSCSPRRQPPTCEPPPPIASMNLSVLSTTGTRYELSVPAEETVEGLKRRLSQRLRVPKERLSLLHRERSLSSGRLQDSGVMEGSKLTLVPTVEAGLMSQASRPDLSVMQALESLTESQVTDFLAGRSPLTLALRIGDHMMFVQLQLAAQNSATRNGTASKAAGGEAGAAATEIRTLHSSASLPRVPVPPYQHSPSTAVPDIPLHCNAPIATPITAGVFRSHGATTSGKSVSKGPEVARTAKTSSISKNGSTGSSGTATPASSQSRKPGAVIESFVNHAPGVFSGTFSGTLHPNCQDSAGRPRRDIGTIIQILNDLLSATRHYQGMPQSLLQLRCQTQYTPSPPPSPPPTPQTTSATLGVVPQPAPVQSQARTLKPTGDRARQTENRATRCKVERLQLLMQQKRMRRKARRDARAPYHWRPNHKVPRSSSVSSEDTMDMEFEDAVWKPEVPADMEFVMA